MRFLFLFLILIIPIHSPAQIIKEYFHVEVEGDDKLPVFIRGNISSGKVLIFVQGGPASTAIDFARSDYPRWKNTLEQKVAIAYYDQRGLNKKVKHIDEERITYHQYSRDLIAVAERIKQKYEVEVYLMGHSFGGALVLHTLKNFVEEADFITGGIALNAPITTGYSEERYIHYRPLYLKNLAQEFIESGQETEFWQEAYDWMVETDSIHSAETSRQWNYYVDHAFTPAKRKISFGMISKVIFSKPYNPVRYLYKKDEDLVGDLLWQDEEHQSTFEQLDQIKLPVLLLTGRFDSIGTPEEQEEAHRLIPNSELAVLPNAAHESFLDNAQSFNETIIEFITNH